MKIDKELKDLIKKYKTLECNVIETIDFAHDFGRAIELIVEHLEEE